MVQHVSVSTHKSQYRRSHQALPWELRRRGLKDSLRHDQRVQEAIRKHLHGSASPWLAGQPRQAPHADTTGPAARR